MVSKTVDIVQLPVFYIDVWLEGERFQFGSQTSSVRLTRFADFPDCLPERVGEGRKVKGVYLGRPTGPRPVPLGRT